MRLSTCVVGAGLLLNATALAHSGGLDKYGCHGGSEPYHCHNGSSDGDSKDALIALAAIGVTWWAIDSVGKRRERINAKIRSSPALQRYDDNRNGRISCREARRHKIAPVKKKHPAYQFMQDRDRDGVVCEKSKRVRREPPKDESET